jgi:hypothetical protein
MKFLRDIGARHGMEDIQRSLLRNRRPTRSATCKVTAHVVWRERCHEDASHTVKLMGQGFSSAAKEGQQLRTRNAAGVLAEGELHELSWNRPSPQVQHSGTLGGLQKRPFRNAPLSVLDLWVISLKGNCLFIGVKSEILTGGTKFGKQHLGECSVLNQGLAFEWNHVARGIV